MSEASVPYKRSSLFERGRLIIESAATLVLVIVAVLMLWDRAHPARRGKSPTVPVPTKAEHIDGVQLRGTPNAKVVVIEYSDFQCPYCARFATDVFPRLLSKYGDRGDVAFAFRHLPMGAIHRRAEEAAISAECAGRQGRFWDVHDRLFQTQTDAAQWNMEGIASAVGLKVDQWAECANVTGKARIAADMKHAAELGISGTPTFLIGIRQNQDAVKVTDVIQGAEPAESFERIIDRLLRSS